MGVQPLRKLKKVASSGKPVIQWLIRRDSSSSVRFWQLRWSRLVRRQRPNAAVASLSLPLTVVPQAKSKQELRPEILAIGLAFMGRYDQALKRLAE